MLGRSCASEDAGLVRGYNADEEFPNELEGIKTYKLPQAGTRKFPKRIFDELPVDVILMIFKYLDTNNIASSVLPVCKIWYNLGRNRVLWKKIVIRPLKLNFSTSLLHSSIAVIQKAELLRCLTLSVKDEVSSILECVGKSCPLLDTLNLSFCSVSSDRAVRSVVSSCLCLKHLYMTDLTGSALTEFAELTTLVEVALHELSGQWFIGWTTDMWMRLSKNNHRLEAMTLSSLNLRDDGQLVPLLTNLNKVLKEIRFSAFLCGRPTFRAISECENLESLRIEGGRLLDSDLNAMEQLKKLKKVFIHLYPDRSRRISPSAWKSFLSNIGSDHIEYVYFGNCDTDPPDLCEVLSTHDDTILHRAKTVHLHDCMELSDHCLKLILTRNPFLESLSLRGSSEFEGLAFNTTDASIAPALRYLNVRHCFMVQLPYLKTFLKNRPGLKIIGPYGKVKL